MIKISKLYQIERDIKELTAKANEIEPYAYLRHIFKALPYANSVENIEALLPWNVKN